jgi:hypothetical protein
MTSIDQVAALATFGSVWAVLSVGHNLTSRTVHHQPRQRLRRTSSNSPDLRPPF